MIRKPLTQIAPWLWFAVLVLFVVTTVQKMNAGNAISLNLVSLLPVEERSPALDDAVGNVRDEFERKWIVLIGSANAERVIALAIQAGEELDAATGAKVDAGASPDTARDIYEFYSKYRHGLMDREFAALLAAGDRERIASHIARRYVDPSALITSQLIEKDPLLLLSAFMGETLPAMPSNARLESGVVSFERNGMHYVPIILDLPERPFSQRMQNKVIAALSDLRNRLAEKSPRSRLLSTGVVLHAAKGTESATREISTVGLGSLIGVVALILFVFRSLKPLIAAIVAISTGFISGLFACLFLFGEVHILTLVFGGSLVGISVDYVFHYYCERAHGPTSLSGMQALAHIRPGITLGLITTLIGFVGLWIAPFPGLRQMAVFSGAGLVAAYLSVCFWFPRFDFKLSPLPPNVRSMIDAVTTKGQRFSTRVLTGGICLSGVVLILGIFQLVPTDDVRLFQSLGANLKAEQEEIEAILSSNRASQFFVVEAKSAETLLQLDEEISDLLRIAGQENFTSVSRFVPSIKRQQENTRLLIETLDTESIQIFLHDALGLAPQMLNAYSASLSGHAAPLTLPEWLGAPASHGHRDLYLGEADGIHRSIILLDVAHDIARLEELANSRPNVHFIDTAGAYSRTFTKYREQTIFLALISYLLVSMVLAWRYGWLGMLTIMTAPVAAAIASLGVIGWVGASFSLFNVMALLLALGISVDYGIFFREMKGRKVETLIAVILSGLTTILAFGLLAFSDTAAIQAFGLTIFVSIAVALLISPIMGGYLKGTGK